MAQYPDNGENRAAYIWPAGFKRSPGNTKTASAVAQAFKVKSRGTKGYR